MEHESVRLGLLPPLTGLVAMYGSEISWAGQIACQEINESGGVLGRPLELVIEDDGSLPESAVTAASTLVRIHRCVAIIGNLLSNSRIAVAYRVAEPHKIPYLNFSFYEGSILSRYFFHFAALPNQQIDQMIPYMQHKFGPRMFFAGNNYEWPRGSIDAAKRVLLRGNGEIVGEEYCPIGVSPKDIERLLENVTQAAPDVFVPYFAGTDQAHLLTRFTEKGLKNRMTVVMGHYDEMLASKLSPEVRAGFYSSNTYFMTVDSPENTNYLDRLAALPEVNGIWPRGNGILTNFGEGTYLCVKAFAQAANMAGSLDSEALVEALETISLRAPQGEVHMCPKTHHAQVNTYLSRCQDDGSFPIIKNFGLIPPVIPERYSHQQISHQATLEEDIRLQARMLEQMSEGVFLLNTKDSTIIYTNGGGERLFDCKKGELTGKHLSLLLAPPGQAQAETASRITSVLAQHGNWQGEISNRREDGSPFWYSGTISTFTHPVHGEVWMAVLRDITEQKQAEESLRQSEERFRTITDSLDALVYVADMDTYELLFLNRYGRETWGDNVGKKCWQVLQSGQSGPCAFCSNDKLLSDDGKPSAGYVWEFQNTANHHWYECRDQAIRWPDGRLVRMEIATDITEKKKLETQLRQAQKMEAVGTLSGGIAHDFNNILTPILGYADIALEIISPDSPATSDIQEVLKAAKRAKELVKQILTFSRQADQELEPLKIQFIITEALKLLRASIPTTIEIRQNIDPECGAVLADLTQIHQIIMNLCTNAYHAMRQSGGVLGVSLSQVTLSQDNMQTKMELQEGLYVLLEVSDTGYGMDKIVLERIFDPYYTTKAKEEGTGLGLSVVHGIVKTLQGDITVDSETGKGLLFVSIYQPLSKPV